MATEGFFNKLFSSAADGAKRALRDPSVDKWLTEIEMAQKREKQYRSEARRALGIYEMATKDAEADKPTYNILYSNTETLSPALYNNKPRPVVQRRFKTGDPTNGAAAKVMQRTLEYLVKCREPDYSTFDELQQNAVTQALVPGRGVSRFKYKPTITQVPQEAESGQEDVQEGGEYSERVDYETICGEEWDWDRVYFGFAATWATVPWVAFEHFWSREEAIENLGEETGSAIEATASPEDGDKNDKVPADSKGATFCHVYEIWDKRTKKVIFISPGFQKPLKEVDDPARLELFFHMPKPLCFLQKVSSSVPQVLYLMYEEQARELNSISRRIINITKALKVRGFYDSTVAGLDQLLTKPDNTLLPAANVAAFLGQGGKSLDNAIWLMPIEGLVAVLQQLYTARAQCIQTIYQITGIADVMRGASAASETLGAQKIKEAWGTMRLKRMQKEVQRYARDSLTIMAELVANNFSIQTLQQMTGLKFPTAAEKQQAQMAFQAQQAQAMMQQQQMGGMEPAMMQGQPPAQAPAQPPQQPQPPAILAQPSWEEILAVLQNDLLRNFSIDIETNSTIDAEATEDKEQVAEFMNAFAQLVNGVSPLVQEGFMPWDVAKDLMLATVQRFRFGQEIEDKLRDLPPPEQKPDPAQQKVEAEMKRDERRFELDQQDRQGDVEARKAEAATKAEIARITLETAKRKAAMDERKMMLEEQLAQARFDREMMQLKMQAMMPQQPQQPQPGAQ